METMSNNSNLPSNLEIEKHVENVTNVNEKTELNNFHGDSYCKESQGSFSSSSNLPNDSNLPNNLDIENVTNVNEKTELNNLHGVNYCNQSQDASSSSSNVPNNLEIKKHVDNVTSVKEKMVLKTFHGDNYCNHSQDASSSSSNLLNNSNLPINLEIKNVTSVNEKMVLKNFQGDNYCNQSQDASSSPSNVTNNNNLTNNLDTEMDVENVTCVNKKIVLNNFHGDSYDHQNRDASSSSSNLPNNSNLANNLEIEKHVENVTNINEKIGSNNFNGDRYRNQSQEDSSSISSDDSSSCSSLEALEDVIKKAVSPVKISKFRTKGELTLDDLPKLEELNISIPESEIKAIGKISGIVDRELIVSSFKNSTPLDIDSILFLSNGKPLGKIFDVFGPVIEPLYSVRFNSALDICEKGFVIDDIVYYAPENDETTSYVFLDSLRKQKGSDASWKDNNEPPVECLDYSDDEQEKQARQKRRAKNRNLDRESISEITNKKPTNSILESTNATLKNNIFSQSFENRISSYRSAKNHTWRPQFGLRNENRPLNSGNRFPAPSSPYNNKPINQHSTGPLVPSPISRPFFWSPTPSPTNNLMYCNNMNQRNWISSNSQKQASFEASVKSQQNMNMSITSTGIHHTLPFSQQQPAFNTPPTPIMRSENYIKTPARVPAKTSSEVLNQTLNQWNTQPISHGSRQFSQFDNSSPSSVYQKYDKPVATNLSKPQASNENYHMSSGTSLQQNSSAMASFKSWQHPIESSQQIHNSLATLGPQISENANSFEASDQGTFKMTIPNRIISESSNQMPFHSNSATNVPPPSNSFPQHIADPLMAIKSPPASLFMPTQPNFAFRAPSPQPNFGTPSPQPNFNFGAPSPQPNFNFGVPSPQPMNAANTKEVQYRPPYNLSPNFVPHFPTTIVSPRIWPSFHTPVFGTLSPISNQVNVPQMLQTNYVPFVRPQGPRPIAVQIVPNVSVTHAQNRVPFYDPRLPPPPSFYRAP